ncbi:uncharacterized protein CEXT_468503 [Caerostris extrusa]|uniref:Uncharacterized protein n=1 Tax=Caerostris extrusa TaxID=172846 RepID=A0AAV4T9R6_CAEEX|nr:uncharacterized protein CEXT_468503 [Caerostris extrusa]
MAFQRRTKSYLRVMASGETPSPLKGPKLSASSSSSRNDCDETQWMLLPNNLEITSQSKPSKKLRNKEKHRSFPQENLASNVTEIKISSSPVGFQNFSRAKCNTASWLKDQIANEKKTTRRRIVDSEEVFSDTDLALPRVNTMNFPVNHASETPEHPEESHRPPSRRSTIDNENTKSNKDECKKNEVMREEFNKIKQAMKQVTEGEKEHKILLQQMVSENGSYAMNGISPASSASKASNCTANMSYRDTDESASMAFSNDEEHANKWNHVLEKMKQSEERLKTLKMQESLLCSMQKKAENKLPTFQAHDQMLPCSDDQELANSGVFWNEDNIAEQRQCTTENTLQGDECDDEEKQLQNWKEPQDAKQLHVSLDRIRKRVQSMQQNPDIKNMTRSISSDDCEIGDRVAAVEFERKRLKNKLAELQEKKSE